MARRPQGLKVVLWLRATAGWTLPCYWCRRPMVFAALTVDHEPSLAEGGSPRQAVLACDECNQRRGRETNARLNAKRSRKR